ncbi:MAG: hypothetical protein AB7S44_01770 [Spirochaetales bacterium]
MGNELFGDKRANSLTALAGLEMCEQFNKIQHNTLLSSRGTAKVAQASRVMSATAVAQEIDELGKGY